MRSAASLALVAGVTIGSALPAAAQQPFASLSGGDGPLARSARIAAARLTAIDTAPQDDNKGWSNVERLPPGARIVVIPRGGTAVERRFVEAGNNSLTVLDVSDPALPKAARDSLVDFAQRHPTFFRERTSEAFVDAPRGVRIDSEGVFVADRKVADLDRVATTYERNQIAEVKDRKRGRGFWGHLGPFGSAFVAGMGAGWGIGLICEAAKDDNDCDGAAMGGLMLGTLGGALYGGYAAHHESVGTVYRKP